MRRLVRAAALFAVVCGATLVAPHAYGGAPAPVLTPSQYAARIDQAAQRLAQAARTGKAGLKLANQALATIPERAQVGAGVIDNRDLLTDLRGQVESGAQGITRASEALRSLHAALTTPATVSPADARRVLTTVLKQREFQESWAQKLQDRIAEWWHRFTEALGKHLPSLDFVPTWVWRLLGWIALICAAGLVIYLIVRLTAGLFGARRPEAPELPLPEPVRPHRDWLAEAEQQFQAGDHRAAVRALYMAALMKLDETGHVSYESFHTDGWFVRALQARGKTELARALSPLSRLFSATWYGRTPAGLHESASARQLWQQVEALAS